MPQLRRKITGSTDQLLQRLPPKTVELPARPADPLEPLGRSVAKQPELEEDAVCKTGFGIAQRVQVGLGRSQHQSYISTADQC